MIPSKGKHDLSRSGQCKTRALAPAPTATYTEASYCPDRRRSLPLLSLVQGRSCEFAQEQLCFALDIRTRFPQSLSCLLRIIFSNPTDRTCLVDRNRSEGTASANSFLTTSTSSSSCNVATQVYSSTGTQLLQREKSCIASQRQHTVWRTRAQIASIHIRTWHIQVGTSYAQHTSWSKERQARCLPIQEQTVLWQAQLPQTCSKAGS